MNEFEGFLYYADDNEPGCVLKETRSGNVAFLVENEWKVSDGSTYSGLRVDAWEVLYEPVKKFAVGDYVSGIEVGLLVDGTVLQPKNETYGLRFKTSRHLVPVSGHPLLIPISELTEDSHYIVKYVPDN